MQYKQITHFLDRLFPDSNVQAYGNALENRIRARVLAGLFFSNFVVIGLALLGFGAMHVFTAQNFFNALLILGLVGAVVALEAMMFYKLGNVSASAIMYSMSFFGVTLGSMIVTGGWVSPVKILFFCSPMISFLIGGKQEGIYISVLVLATGIIMFFADHSGWQIFQIIRPENRPLAEVVIWVISVNLMLTALTVYDALLQDLSRKARP